MSSDRLRDFANDLIAYVLNYTDDVEELKHYLHSIGYKDDELREFDLGDDQDA